MRKRDAFKRMLSLLLAFCMVIGYVPVPAFAAEDGICAHHEEHDDSCGFAEAQSCGHVCTEECQQEEVISCQHTCTEETCLWVEAVEEAFCGHVCGGGDCSYAPATEETEEVPCDYHSETCGCAPAVEAHWDCTHECTVDTGCVTYHCLTHVCPEGDCGYAEAGQCIYALNGCADCEEEALEDTPVLPQVKTISAWSWDDEWDVLSEDGTYATFSQTDWATLTAYLPQSITATVDGEEGVTLAITWECESFPAEGEAQGTYELKAILPEGYALGENVTALELEVDLGTVQQYAITPTQPENGDGSENDPYQITSADELYWFAEHVNAGNASACAKLMNDITVNEKVIVNGALNSDPSGFAAWTPIGKIINSNNIKAFSGTFDGNNMTISGLYVSATSGYQGLIGYMQSGTVKNVTVANSYFSGTKNIGAVVGCYGQTETASIVTNCHNVGSIVIASDYYAGGVVGGRHALAAKNEKIVVSGCSNSGSVTGAKHYVGGIIGYAAYFSEGKAISDCTNTGTVTNTSTSRAQGTGGIAGYFGGSSDAKVEIVNCTNSGKISIADGGQQDYMGGIIGHNSYGYISNCNNTGTISGYLMAGGIVGINSGTVANCKNTGAVSGTGSQIGGVVGSNGGTVTDCTNSAAVQGQWYVGGINGSGTGLSGCTNTGDVTSNTYGAGGVIGYVKAAGTVKNCHNKGKVKGSSYYIGGLVGYHYSGQVTYTECSNAGDVEGSSYDIGGLFGRISDSSKVTQCYNTGNVTCTGTYSTDFDHGVGGLAGVTFSAAMFENCYNTGAVNGGSNENVGGLVGFFTYASGSMDHYIKNSYNTGSVTGGQNTGGLFGSYESINVSENCYNTGAVTGGQNTGGLVGYHFSTGSGKGVIKNCYNIGSVGGTTYVGGLFGYSFYDDCLETSYNVGPVSGTSSIGGVIGNSNYKSVINCYYLDTCVTKGNTVTGATALTAQQMTDDTNLQTNFTGFDTTTPVWSKQNNEGTKKYLPKLDSYSPTLHIHSWTYSADGTTITATCNIDGCSSPNGGSVTISAPTDLIYSNSSKNAACSYSNWLPDKEETIVYNTVDRINVTGEDITASITIGDATASVSYQITPREITTSMVTLSPSSATYNGSEKTVTVTVKDSSTTLTAGTDYEFTGITSATEISTGSGYAVTVAGKGNYSGTVTRTWKINKASLSAAIEIEDWTYLDDPKAPSVTSNPEKGEVTYTYYVTYSGRAPTKTGTAHGAKTEGGVPSYAGTYYVGASIAETEHYKQTSIYPSATTEFVISPREVSNPTFEGLDETYLYDNGNEIKPTFTLKDDKNNVIPESEYTVTYSDNTAVGEATITITDVGQGNYTISGTKTFEIVAHEHAWSYEANGDTITATCTADGCGLENKDGGTVTIAVPDSAVSDSLVYTGEAIPAKVTNSLTDEATTVTVVYTKDGETLTGAPSAPGTYTATITLGEAEISVEYTIYTTITFNANGGAWGEETSKVVTTIEDAKAMAFPTKEGYDCTWDPTIPDTMPATNITIKAVWTVTGYSITYDLAGGELAEGVTNPTTYNIESGTFTLNNPTRTGYTFTGWTGSNGDTAQTEVQITKGSTGDKSYTANWEEITHTVTFNANGGQGEMKSQTLGEAVKKALTENAFTKTGYSFLGWATTPDGEVAYTDKAEITVMNNTTLYAVWSANSYKATFDANGGAWADGDTTKTVPTAFGSTITAPADPTKTGHTFAGWEPTVGTMDDVNGKSFTAKWTVNTYDATFNANGGAWKDGATTMTVANVTFGTAITAPTENPTRTGYTFHGWSPEVGNMDAEGKDFTAQWTINQYTITFDTDGSSDVAAITQDYNTAVTAPADPTKTGYTFAGWDKEVPATMPAENVTITAEWTINQYTITFDTDGGSDVAAITQDYNTAVTAPADPTKTGYTFAGWDVEIPTPMPAENVTIKAKWTVNQYTITFDTDGGSAIDPIKQDYNTAVEKPADPTKTGYTFAGWDEEVPTTMPAENVTITAEWTINQYTITFDTDGGSAIEAITQDYNTAVTAPADPTKTGYTFAGWDKEVPATMPAEDVTIKAKWTVNQYTITFDTDGGSAIDPIKQDYNTAVEKPADPTKTGYTFAGWNEEVPPTMPAENVTVKAKWTVNKYSVTWIVDGVETVNEINFGDPIVKPQDPTKLPDACTTYAFAGWDKDIPETMPAENLTFTAKFDEDKDANHSWDEGKITTPATCSEVGVKTYTCEHDASHTRTEDVAIDANAHSWNDGEITTAATCSEVGVKTFTCKHDACHTRTEDVAIDETAHSWNDGEITTDPICTKAGVKTYTCKYDASHTYTEEVAAKGHTLTQVAAQATTCEAIGWDAYEKCSECDYTTYKEISALGHNYVGVVTTEPTCTEKGVKTYTCKNDATHTYTEEVAANGHTLTQVAAQAATCEAIGWDAYEKCSVCDYTTYKEISALGHGYDDGVITTEPTCTEKGVKTFTCKNDATHIYTEEIRATGHSYVKTGTVEPTCTEQGYSIYTCVCGDSFDSDYVNAIGHSDSDGNWRCDVCGEEICRRHTERVIPGVEPTCEEPGLTEGAKCSVCGEILVAQEVIPALGHNFEDGACTNCGCEYDEGLLGDADRDGIITSTDARLVLQYSVKLISEEDLNLSVCDVDGDGKYTSTDARLILQYSVKLITMFPVE